MAAFILVGDYQLLEGTCHLQLEIRIYPADGGNRFFQNFSACGCRVSYIRRP
jgi:hypothetical protein